MVEKIYIARHGVRPSFINSTWKSVTGLERDPPLTAYGETQAEELAQYFLSLPEEERPTALFSSPYYRCLQTSKPVANALNIPIYVEHGVAEWYSPATPGTGLHPRPGSSASLKEYISEIDRSWETIWYPSRKGETVDEIHNRIDGFLELFVPTVEQKFHEKAARILIVSHAATTISLVMSLVGDRNLRFNVGCCSLSELKRRPGASNVVGGWEALKVADGTHLDAGSSREWGFADIEVEEGKVVDDPGVPGTEDEVDHPVGPQIPLHMNSNL